MYFERQKSAFSKSEQFEEQKINISLQTKDIFLAKSHRIAENEVSDKQNGLQINKSPQFLKSSSLQSI